jgi:hypothetical protein
MGRLGHTLVADGSQKLCGASGDWSQVTESMLSHKQLPLLMMLCLMSALDICVLILMKSIMSRGGACAL